jgi:hypothetical protein
MSDEPRRVITIYCDDASHDPLDLAALVSNPHYEPERWEADDRAERQHWVHPDDADAAPGMLHALGHVTERVKFRCDLCGRDVTLGDRVGVGYETMLSTRASDALGTGYRTRPDRRPTDRLTPSAEGESIPVPVTPMRPDIALAIAGQPTPSTNPALHEMLSRWADAGSDIHGVSRLSLSGLDRIVKASS